VAELPGPRADDPVLTLLFICTHNRCRSILCEALARHLSAGRIAAFSAGSQPAGAVHPDTLLHLQKHGVDISGLRSESWDAYANLSPDAVITVCDSAAGEQCPLWLGQAVKVHWGLPDPSRCDGTEEERATAFDTLIATIERRLQRLLDRDLCTLKTADALRRELQQLAQGSNDHGAV
jgi:arsenate reductase